MEYSFLVPAIALLAVTVPIAPPALAAPSLMSQDSGAPVGDNQVSKTAGQDGPVSLKDFALIEKLARFDRERIPERVVIVRFPWLYNPAASRSDVPQRDHKTAPLGEVL